MAELAALSALLHSLQVKLSVADQATHPKVYMWSAPWEDQPEEDEDAWCRVTSPHHQQATGGHFLQQQAGEGQQPALPFSHHENFVLPADLGEGGNKISGGKLAVPAPAGETTQTTAAVAASTITSTLESCDSAVSSEQEPRPGVHVADSDFLSSDPNYKRVGDEVQQMVSGGTSAAQRGDGVMELGPASGPGDDGGKKELRDMSSSSLLPLSSSSSQSSPSCQPQDTIGSSSTGGGTNCEPAGAGAPVDPFSFFDFPSLNEVKELLPSVLKDISSMEDLAQQSGLPPPSAAILATRSPAPSAGVTIIPEPKLINREESRINLIGHIEHLQSLVGERLDLVEQRLDSLESPEQLQLPQELLDCSNIVQSVARLLTDVKSMKKVNHMLPERI